jgi:hypothetical protein
MKNKEDGCNLFGKQRTRGGRIIPAFTYGCQCVFQLCQVVGGCGLPHNSRHAPRQGGQALEDGGHLALEVALQVVP